MQRDFMHQGKGKPTDACFLVLGFVVEVIGISIGDIVQLLRLVLIEIDGILVQDMLDCVFSKLVVGVEHMEMLDSLAMPSKVVVDFEMASGFRGLL